MFHEMGHLLTEVTFQIALLAQLFAASLSDKTCHVCLQLCDYFLQYGHMSGRFVVSTLLPTSPPTMPCSRPDTAPLVKKSRWRWFLSLAGAVLGRHEAFFETRVRGAASALVRSRGATQPALVRKRGKSKISHPCGFRV